MTERKSQRFAFMLLLCVMLAITALSQVVTADSGDSAANIESGAQIQAVVQKNIQGYDQDLSKPIAVPDALTSVK
jgi:hypothetical protein